MKSTRNPFLINIGFLINQPIGYARAIPFDLEEVDFGDGLAVDQLNGEMRLIRNQDGFRSKGIFSGSIANECARCLEPYQERLNVEFEEFFTFPLVESSDDEIQVPESGNVDFKPILHDYLLIEIPINAVCKPDCKGLCDICGVNRNIKDCGHEHKKMDDERRNKLDLEHLKEQLDT